MTSSPCFPSRSSVKGSYPYWFHLLLALGYLYSSSQAFAQEEEQGPDLNEDRTPDLQLWTETTEDDPDVERANPIESELQNERALPVAAETTVQQESDDRPVNILPLWPESVEDRRDRYLDEDEDEDENDDQRRASQNTTAASETAVIVFGAGEQLRCERCLDGHPVMDAAGPWSLGMSTSFGFGLVHPNGKQRVFIGRKFRDRITLEIEFAFSLSSWFIDLEATANLGLLVHISRRIDLDFFARLGYATFRLREYDIGWVPALTTSLGLNLRILLHQRVELRVALLVVTGFWNQFWGIGAEPTLTVAYRF